MSKDLRPLFRLIGRQRENQVVPPGLIVSTIFRTLSLQTLVEMKSASSGGILKRGLQVLHIYINCFLGSDRHAALCLGNRYSLGLTLQYVIPFEFSQSAKYSPLSGCHPLWTRFF